MALVKKASFIISASLIGGLFIGTLEADALVRRTTESLRNVGEHVASELRLPEVVTPLEKVAERLKQAEERRQQARERYFNGANHDAGSEGTNQEQANSGTELIQQQEITTSNELPRSQEKNKLAGDKLVACKQREQSILKVVNSVHDKSQRQFDVLQEIDNRLQSYYSSLGLVGSDLDVYIEELATRRAIAGADLLYVKETASDFNCNGNNPREFGSYFKATHGDYIASVHDYRLSLKEMISRLKEASRTNSTTREVRNH